MARDTVRRAHLVRVGWLSKVIAVAIAPAATWIFATTLDWSTVQAGLAGVLFAGCVGAITMACGIATATPLPRPDPRESNKGAD
jgi:hypothetical protein